MSKNGRDQLTTVRHRYPLAEEDEMLACIQLRGEFATPQDAQIAKEIAAETCEILPNHNRLTLSAGCRGEVPNIPRTLRRSLAVYLDEVAGQDPRRRIWRRVYVEAEEGFEEWKPFHGPKTAAPGESRSLRSAPINKDIYIFSSDSEGSGDVVFMRGSEDGLDMKVLGRFELVKLHGASAVVSGGWLQKSIREFEREIATIVAEATQAARELQA